MSTKMFMYPPMQKTSPEPAGFSSLLPCQTSWRNPYPFPLHPHCSLFNALQSGFTQHFSETVFSGLSIPELNDCFFRSAFLILLCVCNIYTIEQPFLGGVASLKDVILCHNCECSHITLKVYLLKCTLRFCLQNASGGISSLGFLFYPTVLCSISGPKFQTHTFNYLFDISA